MAHDHLAWRELAKVRDVGYIDLPTGRSSPGPENPAGRSWPVRIIQRRNND